MAFPSSPTVGQTYAAPNGTTYEWTADGAWKKQAGSASLTLPANAAGALTNDGAGNLTWVPDVDTALPADAAGFLENDGAGTLSWGTPAGGVTLPADAAGVLTNDGAGVLTWETSSSSVPGLTDVGSVIFAGRLGGNFTNTQTNPGDSVSGTDLYYAGNDPTAQGSNVGVGTWRAQGFTPDGGPGDFWGTLFVRIS